MFVPHVVLVSPDCATIKEMRWWITWWGSLAITYTCTTFINIQFYIFLWYFILCSCHVSVIKSCSYRAHFSLAWSGMMDAVMASVRTCDWTGHLVWLMACTVTLERMNWQNNRLFALFISLLLFISFWLTASSWCHLNFLVFLVLETASTKTYTYKHLPLLCEDKVLH